MEGSTPTGIPHRCRADRAGIGKFLQFSPSNPLSAPPRPEPALLSGRRSSTGKLHPHPQTRHKRGGVTFIELIGVLVVAIIIIAGAIALYTEANTSSRTNQLLVAIGTIAGSMRGLHANTSTYGGSFTAPYDARPVIISSNSVPPGMLIEVSGAIITLRHAFGGDIVVAGTGQMFFIAATGLERDICIRLATESTAKSSSGLRGVYVGPTGSSLTDNSTKIKRIDDAINSGSRGVLDSTNGTIFVTSVTTSAGPTNVPIAPLSADTACSTHPDRMVGWLLQ